MLKRRKFALNPGGYNRSFMLNLVPQVRYFRPDARSIYCAAAAATKLENYGANYQSGYCRMRC